METLTKCCTKCGETKPLEAFPSDKRYVSGISSRCAQCKQAAEKEQKRAHAASPAAKAKAVLRQLRYAAKPEAVEKIRAAEEAHKRSNPEAYRARYRRAAKKRMETMAASYIVGTLLQRTHIPRDRVPRELIDLHRLHLAIKRELKNEQHH
jgi:hypothetical protein